MGLPHRYGYAVAVGASDGIVGTESVLLRHDFERGTAKRVLRARGERWARPSSCPETTTPTRRRAGCSSSSTRPRPAVSALHILNAEDMTGEAEAVIELPQRVPAGFHGNWVPDQG